jgi:hypothetical protein
MRCWGVDILVGVGGERKADAGSLKRTVEVFTEKGKWL